MQDAFLLPLLWNSNADASRTNNGLCKKGERINKITAIITNMRYDYPLKIHFRFLALAPRISVTNATGNEILYIEQKTFALREAVRVFDNSKAKNLLYMIKANQILDFGAKYHFSTADGNQSIGSIQQDGMRSLFQASYSVFDKKDKQIYKVTQTNPMIAVLDSLLSFIPFAELLTGFILNPTYKLSETEQSEPLLFMKKKPSFLESTFTITRMNKDVSDEQELTMLLALLMIVQLERNRG